MFERVEVAVKELAVALDDLDASRLSGLEAVALIRVVSNAERVLASARVMATRRVDETKAWQHEGHRSMVDWMAGVAGTRVKDAAATLQTARKLQDLPLVAGEFRAGRLSEEQVRVISDAAWVSPAHERHLIASAQAESIKTLEQECRKVRMAADPEQAETLRRIYRGRYAKFWSEPDGAIRLDARLTPEDGAEVVAAVERAKTKVFDQARRRGIRQSTGAYLADAIVKLITRPDHESDGSGDPGPRAVVNVFVDHQVLVSGVASAEDTCEIQGLGSIPAETAQALLEDSILRVLVTDGCDVRAISKDSRTIPVRLRRAIVARDRVCVVPGCDRSALLEIDHIIPRHQHGPTELANLCRLCKSHHAMKTILGYRITGKPGAWVWETPSDQEGPRPPPPDHE